MTTAQKRPTDAPLPVVIVGAGMAGLTAAWWLHQANIPVTVLERGGHAGGVVGTTHIGGHVFERGPSTVIANAPALNELIDQATSKFTAAIKAVGEWAKKGVTALAFNRAGNLLASAGKDTDIVVWDVIAEAGQCRLQGHKDAVTDVHFLEDADRPLLISTSKDTLGLAGWSNWICHSATAFPSCAPQTSPA